jgi:hypothetical protein
MSRLYPSSASATVTMAAATVMRFMHRLCYAFGLYYIFLSSFDCFVSFNCFFSGLACTAFRG